MKKFAVRLFKNQYQPLDIPATIHVKHGDYVLVRTEKGEEVAQAQFIPPAIAKAWENKAPQALPLIRVMGQRDLEEYEVLKRENEVAFKKCKELVEKRNLNMNLLLILWRVKPWPLQSVKG